METADGNSTTAGQNWQGSFTFTKGLAPDIQNPTDPQGHYLNVSVKYDPTALECNNNVVDPGETCDPPGSCPVDCEPSGEACAPNVIVGTSAACTAACAIVPITACVSGDGCCAAGCGPLSDADCTEPEIGGGCTTGGSSSSAPIAFGVLGALLAFAAVAAARSRYQVPLSDSVVCSPVLAVTVHCALSARHNFQLLRGSV